MKSKTTAIFASLMTGLMLMGASYAMWSKALAITGTVYTGNVDAEFSYFDTNDPEVTADGEPSLDPKGAGTWTYGTSFTWTGDRYDKNVGYVSVDYGGTDDGINKGALVVTVNNAYPCYCPGVAFTIENTGSIPVKINSIKLTMVSEDGNKYSVNWDLVASHWVYWVRDHGLTETAPSDWQYIFAIHISEIYVGEQIDPPTGYVLGDLSIHIGQQAYQDTTYDFAIEIEVAQWNEVG